ncbi:subunit of axonemal inner dynein [Dunaliella salina]|uniref:Subunit of axonemal inner dynein n=1 Tax=Dunaliella salina TaxID=3046 RepID=A0ABQ7H4K7_DUNSA|nr:subunit of axonemal inner dynein [Dunaliella salina]|eukprot:KAF5841781.1 subunit of axonemal inner dynein [Dunaliella salina]
MAATLTYTVFSLGEAQLHQIHTSHGKLFVMGEVAVELFQESPTAFLQELRKGKTIRTNSVQRDVLHTVAELQLPVESTIGTAGVTLLPASSVESLLLDKRRHELVQPFKLALLKLASQLFPLYLLAAQANLGLRRSKQCEDFLALASWLAMKEPAMTSNVMKSQLSRLYGQLYAFQGRRPEALSSFAEDVYYCSMEYGPEDPRTSLGYYNLGKVFQSASEVEKAKACNDQVVKIWTSALCQVVLGVTQTPKGLVAEANAPAELPVGRLQLMEVVDMLLDIGRSRAVQHGPESESVGDVHFVAALALIQLEEPERAEEQLAAAAELHAIRPDPQRSKLMDMARIMLSSI